MYTYFRESSSYVDEVALWNRALSGAEVQQMYNNSNGFIYPFRTVAATTLSPTDTSVTVTYDPITVVATSTLYTTPYPFVTDASTTAVHTLTDATTTGYTVYSPFEGYEYDSRGSNTTSFTLNGTLVGTYTYDRSDPTSGKVTYTITNYLGTPVLSTDENGDIVESFLTDVFGNLYYRDARQDNAFHSKGYTSHTFDSESGLTYAHARYLDTSVHTFLSVDPIQYNLTKEELSDPQSLNGYAYARNNPVSFKDPDGKEPVTIFAAIMLGSILMGNGLILYGAITDNPKIIETGYSMNILGTSGTAGLLVPQVSVGIIKSSAPASNPLEDLAPKMGESGGKGAGKRFSEEIKQAAREESEGNCVFCKKPTTRSAGPSQSQIDHAIPKSVGGNNTLSNAQNTCRTCNLQKGALTTNQYIEKQMQTYNLMLPLLRELVRSYTSKM